MRWPVALLVSVGLATAGCQTCEPVESELRAREQDVAQLREELARLQAEHDALQHEVQGAHQSSAAKFTPEMVPQPYTVTCVVLARQTGGYDGDKIPGDEALQVVLEPHDPDGQSIKAPGSLEVQALEITPEGLKKPLCSWQIPPEQLRHTWRSGLLSTGYVLVLPWKVWPSSPRVRVVAHFTLADGKPFEAEKDVTIRLVPPAVRKVAPVETPGVPTLVPPDGEPLPPPRKVDPVAPEGTKGPGLETPARGTGSATTGWWSQRASLAGAVQVQRPVPVP